MSAALARVYGRWDFPRFWSTLFRCVTRTVSQQSLADHVTRPYPYAVRFRPESRAFFHFFHRQPLLENFKMPAPKSSPHAPMGTDWFYEWARCCPTSVGTVVDFNFFGVNGSLIKLYQAIYIVKSGVFAELIWTHRVRGLVSFFIRTVCCGQLMLNEMKVVAI